MHGRRALAFALPLTLVLAATLPAVATAKTIKPLPGRFAGRCATKDINSCHDVLLSSSTPKTQLYFQLQKDYCSAVHTASAGVWAYTPDVTFKKGAFTTKFVYNNMIPGHTNDANAFTIAFTLKGRYTSKSVLKVTIAGKVTNAVAPVDDCAGESFSEVHTLKHVTF